MNQTMMTQPNNIN